LRYAPLNVYKLLGQMGDDLGGALRVIPRYDRYGSLQVAVTCADQLGVTDPYKMVVEMFGDEKPTLISFGPTREDVYEPIPYLQLGA